MLRSMYGINRQCCGPADRSISCAHLRLPRFDRSTLPRLAAAPVRNTPKHAPANVSETLQGHRLVSPAYPLGMITSKINLS